MIGAAQVRAARKLLNWTPDRLAKHARLTLGVVLQAEREDGMTLLPPAAARALRNALEEAGVECLPSSGEVRLRVRSWSTSATGDAM